MARIIHLNRYMYQIARTQIAGHRVITPHPGVAVSLSQTPLSLIDIATEYLKLLNLLPASELISHRVLRSVIETSISRAEGSATKSFALTIKKILRAGIDVANLNTISSLRTQKITSLTELYCQTLRSLNLIDIDEIFMVLNQAIKKGLIKVAKQKIFVYGYPYLLNEEITFIDHIASDESLLFLSCGDHPLFNSYEKQVATLEANQWTISECTSLVSTIGERNAEIFLINSNPHLPVKENDSTIQAYHFPHLEAEVRGVLALIKKLLARGVAQKDIVITIRDEQRYMATLISVAWEYDLRLRVFYEQPLMESKLGTWLRQLLKAIEENFPFERMMRIFQHPLGPGLDLDQQIDAIKHHWAGLNNWQKHLQRDLSLLQLPAYNTRRGWIKRLNEILDLFKVPQRVLNWPEEKSAYEILTENLNSLPNSDEQLDCTTFIGEIIELLAITKSPLAPDLDGIAVHLTTMAGGARYRHLFILGAAEDILPEAIHEDTNLDFLEKRHLTNDKVSLESAKEIAAREYLNFWWLLQSATESITITYPKEIDNQEYLPSRYFQLLNIKPININALPLASIEEARRIYLRSYLIDSPPFVDNVMLYIKHAWQVEMHRESSAPFDEYDGVININLPLNDRIFSASQITAFGQCPFKWFINYLLGLSRSHENLSELTPGLLGRFYHKALELALSWVKGSDGDIRQALIARLEDALIEAARIERIPKLQSQKVLRDEALRMLTHAVQGEDFIIADAEVIGLETRFYTSWQGLSLVGELDRIDHTAEGLVLIDYKTSSTPPLGAKSSDGRPNLDVQLPLYLHAATTSLFPGEKIIDAFYYSLSRGKILKRAKVDDQQLQQLSDKIKDYCANGSFPVMPDRQQEVCNQCSFDLVCRRGPRLLRKELFKEEEQV